MSHLEQLVEGAVEPTESLRLVLALIWVVQHHYAKQTSSPLTLAQFSTKRESHWYHRDLIGAVLIGCEQEGRWSLPTGKIFYLESKSLEKGEHVEKKLHFPSYTCKDEAIFFLDSLLAYYALERELLNESNNYKRNGFFCIVYTGKELQYLTNIRKIFEHLFALYVTKVNVFVLSRRTPYVYTYFPFESGKCHWSKPQYYLSFAHITKALDTYELGKDFFPRKLTNMQGCELKVTTFNSPPYILIERDAVSGDFRRLAGIEGSLMSLLAELMNFTIRFVPAPDNDRGFIYKNGTATGATKMVIDGRTNITIGVYMYDQRRSNYTQPAYSYLTAPLLIAIPRGRPLSPFQRLIKPFKYIIWISLSASVLAGMCFIILLRWWRRRRWNALVFGRGNRTPLSNLCNTLLGGALAGVLPRGNLGRYLLAIWLLYTLVLRSAYQGELFIMLQDGRARTALQSIDEAVAQNYTFHATRTIGNILKMSFADAKVRYLDRSNLLASYIPRLRSSRERLAVPMLLHTVRMYNQRASSYAQRLSVLPEKFVTVPITFYMRQHSYLLHEMDTLLQRFATAGLMEKFERQYVDPEVDRNLRRQSTEPVVLSIWTLFGLFSIYLLLLFFCALVFLLELWAPRSPLVAALLDVLNC